MRFPYILSSSSTLSANANISAGIGRDAWFMLRTLNGDCWAGDCVAARIMWRGWRRSFGVCDVLRGSGSGVLWTLSLTAIVIFVARRSLSDNVRWRFIPFPFSMIAPRDASFAERTYVFRISIQKQMKASASLSYFSGRDPCAELVPVPLSSIVDVKFDIGWHDVNKTSTNKSWRFSSSFISYYPSLLSPFWAIVDSLSTVISSAARATLIWLCYSPKFCANCTVCSSGVLRNLLASFHASKFSLIRSWLISNGHFLTVKLVPKQLKHVVCRLLWRLSR